MAIPQINYYKFKSIDDTPSVEAYKAAVDGVVEQYDKNKEEKNKLLRAIGSIQSNAHGNEYLKAMGETINKSLEQISTDVAGSKNWHQAADVVDNLVNKFANDKVVQAIQLSQKNHLEAEQVKTELSKTGEVVNIGDEYDDYKPLNPDGTVKVFQPLYQRKADTYGAIKKIAKDLPTEVAIEISKEQRFPGLIEVNQVKRAIAGAKERLLPTYLEQYRSTDEANQKATVLRKQLTKEGKTEAQIQKAIEKEQYDEVSHSLDLYEQEVYENKPQLIADIKENREAASANQREMFKLQTEARKEDRSADREDRQLFQKEQNEEQRRARKEALEFSATERRYLEAQQEKQRLLLDKQRSDDRKWAVEQQTRQRKELQEDRQKEADRLQEDRQKNEESMIRLRAKLNQETAVAKAKAKASGHATDENTTLLSRGTGIGHQAGDEESVTKVNSSDYLKGFEGTIDKPIGKGNEVWKGVAFDKTAYKGIIDTETDEITGFTPQGINAHNTSGSDFDGSWYGDLTYKDANDKTHTIKANIINSDVRMRSMYGTVSQVKHDVDQLTRARLPNSGILATLPKPADPNLFDGTKKQVFLRVVKTKGAIRVQPMINIAADANGKPLYEEVGVLTKEQKEKYGLTNVKSFYTDDQIRTMADNDFASSIHSQILTRSKLPQLNK